MVSRGKIANNVEEVFCVIDSQSHVCNCVCVIDVLNRLAFVMFSTLMIH